MFEKPLVLAGFFKVVWQPICNVVGVASDSPICSLPDEGQEKEDYQ
jgi:hypothetical protein